MKTIAIWGVVSIAASLLAGVLAGVKNRNYSTWMAWSFLVPPLVLVLLFMPKHRGQRPRQPSADELDHLEST